MMRRIVLKAMMAFAMAAQAAVVAAQNSDSIDVCQFVVAYDYRCNTFDKNGEAVVDSFKLAVEVGTRVTKCLGFYRAMTEDLGEGLTRSYQEGEWMERPWNIPVWYINYPEGEMQTQDKVVPNWYHVRGVAPKIDWEIMGDTLTVGGYLCQKAEGDYAGRRWTAWFTEEIASPVGPWKLRGLPGLILKAEADGIHEFAFCGLLNRQCKIGFSVGHKYTKVEQKKFVKFRNKVLTNKQYVQNPRYYIPVGALDGAVEMWAGGPEPAPEDKVTLITRDMIVPKTANVYQPLELK